MTSHYRHRRIFNPVTAFPTLIEPGEIMVNTANRQLALGDADPASPGSVKQLLGVRVFDAKAQYVTGDFVVQAGTIYRSKGATGPGAFDPAQWDNLASDAATKAYIDSADAAITTAYQNADTAIVSDYQAFDASLANMVNNKVSKSGDVMSGALMLSGTPTDDREAANKKYVDDTVATGGKTPTAAQIASVPSGTLSSGNVQAALDELDLEKAPLASPLFNGNPRAPTRMADDASISIATTAFVVGQAGNQPATNNGTAAPGSSLRYAREDHVHPFDATRAPIDSPVFTGDARLQNNPPPGDNDTSIATTAFVQQSVGAAQIGFSTGDAKLTFKSVADGGWVMMNDGTIGDASSGGTTRAGADCRALFILFWDSIPDTYAPVVGGRGANSSADWSAHKAITLPRALGRAIAIAGNGASLSGRAVGQYLGEEDHVLIPAEGPNMPVSGSMSGSGPISANLQTLNTDTGAPFPGNKMLKPDMGGDQFSPTYTNLPVTGTASVSGSISGATTGGGTKHNNMPPTSFMNVMVKL